MLVIVDEAYLEFVRMDDAIDGLATYRAHSNVVLTRTFSKAYGLAGFRVGYAVGPARHWPGRCARCPCPSGSRSVAQAAAIASLDATEALFERVDALTAERSRVLAAVRDAGWELPDAQGNFVWFPLGSGPRSSPPRPTSSASSCAPSPASAPGSPSARPRPTTG